MQRPNQIDDMVMSIDEYFFYIFCLNWHEIHQTVSVQENCTQLSIEMARFLCVLLFCYCSIGPQWLIMKLFQSAKNVMFSLFFFCKQALWRLACTIFYVCMRQHGMAWLIALPQRHRLLLFVRFFRCIAMVRALDQIVFLLLFFALLLLFFFCSSPLYSMNFFSHVQLLPPWMSAVSIVCAG